MTLKEYWKDHLLFLDGGTGTLLQEAGLQGGEASETWNLSHPDVVKNIAKSYYDAGSNVVCANTFGANGLKYGKEELKKIIFAAVELVKQAQEESEGTQKKFVALDVGSLGRLLKPLGDLDFEDAVAIFAQTVRFGAEAGADLVFIETMTDSYETKAALLAAKENCDLPVFVSNAYGKDGRLLNGADPESMVALLEGMGADAIGANCSLGPDQLMPVVNRLLAAASVPVLLKPNAGLPRAEGNKTVFDVTPQAFADSMITALNNGVRIAGGCCGTTPEYIKALTHRAKGISPKPVERKHFCRISSYTHAVTFAEDPILIGERINPTGKKRFQQALRERDMGYVLQEGLKQAEQGVQVLDVNVGLADLDEVSLLPETVCALQSVTDLPLQIDTANPAAMEKALRRYNGKALINSVNGKRESMDQIFPLMKKYGGVAIALTLDEKGIPATAQGRVEVAEKILKEAEKYGFGKEDLIFDPLAMTVSADNNAAQVTLQSLKLLSAMGCRTSLGISNISFGLPQRDTVNGVFFACALEQGLSAAIMNPYSVEMQKVYHAHRLLRGRDENCARFLAFAQTLPVSDGQNTVAAAAPVQGVDTLAAAIGKGLKEEAAGMTRELLQTLPPLQIVTQQIIPALDQVGKGFEEKTVFLPQLLMSAEAAKEAFEQIKQALPAAENETKKGPVILATVKGDVHDIGKNIVKLLLENYGFAVVDLGKDVAPEAVLEAARTRNAPLVGLSALMTTTVPAMEETVALLKDLPHCRVMVGGAVLTEAYAREIGADFYGKDAMSAVRYAETCITQNAE